MSLRLVVGVSLVVVGACDKPKRDPWGSNEPAPPSAANKDPWASADDPSPASPTPSAEQPPASSNVGLPEGPWRCFFLGSNWMNGARFSQAIAMNGFTVHGDRFTSDKEGDGTFELQDLYLVFHGGGFDNWRGALNVHDDRSVYLVFGGESHRDALPGKGAAFGDVQCEPQP
ncbi:MAG TPA: hypothetical protein VGM39_06965 [Kofleriaceae bacterium]|jgi:hypothetical protein